MTGTKHWHSWVIKRNRFDSVVAYIRDNIPEIDKYFYPQIKKEYPTKRGVRVKDCPLYEGYLFVRYNDHTEVFHKMSRYPFITTYAGPVTEEEISRMQEAQGKLISEIQTSKYNPGELVTLLQGPFKGFEGMVIEASGDIVKVMLDAQILGKQGVEMAFDEDMLERKSEFQNTEVQDI